MRETRFILILSLLLTILSYVLLLTGWYLSKVFTPHLVEAAKNMGLIEALLSGKPVVHLWLAYHVLFSVTDTVLFLVACFIAYFAVLYIISRIG